MQMGDLTSLAEVGVGINLAFSLIHGVRKRLADLLAQWLEVQKDQLYTILHEYMEKNGKPDSEIVIKLDDVYDDFVNRCKFIELLFVTLAFVAALSLVYFLYETAKTPSASIKDHWGLFTYAVVMAPLLGNYLFQTLVFVFASAKLMVRRISCHISTKILSAVIKPKEPE